MVAHRVGRQLQARGDLFVGQAFANQTQYIALAGGEVGEGNARHVAAVDAFGVGQFFDQGLAEPGGVLHHFLDGRYQLQFRAFAFGDVHQYQQVAGYILDDYGIGGHHAVDHLIAFLAHLQILPVEVAGFFQGGEQLRAGLGAVDEVDVFDGFADQLFAGVAGHAHEGFVDIHHLPVGGAVPQVGTGVRRNDLAKRSSLWRRAISALRRGSRSVKENNMQSSSFMSNGWPATITNLLPPSGNLNSACICGMVAPSPRRWMARSLRSACSSTSSSYTERPITAGAGLALNVFSKRSSALAHSVASLRINTSNSGSPRESDSTRLRRRWTQLRSPSPVGVTSTTTSLNSSPAATRLRG